MNDFKIEKYFAKFVKIYENGISRIAGMVLFLLAHFIVFIFIENKFKQKRFVL